MHKDDSKEDKNIARKILSRIQIPNPIPDFGTDEYFNLFKKIIRYIIKTIYTSFSDELFVLEGIDLINMEYSIFKGQPLIFKNTSILKSAIRNINRAGKYGSEDEKNKLKAVIKYLKAAGLELKATLIGSNSLLSSYIRDEKDFEKMKSEVHKESYLCLETLLEKKYIGDKNSEFKKSMKLSGVEPTMRRGDFVKESLTEDNLDWIENYLMEENEDESIPSKKEPIEKVDKKPSFPKKTDAQEVNKNGLRRKKLYIAFIEWAKQINPKNSFGSVFDKDIFHNLYKFIPPEMRYFYRIANPILCVLDGDLTFFAVSELRKLNANNPKLQEMMIFAATNNDLRIFNNYDKKVYIASEENNIIKLNESLGNSFDLYLQKMINAGDILNSPLEESMIKYEEVLKEINKR